VVRGRAEPETRFSPPDHRSALQPAGIPLGPVRRHGPYALFKITNGGWIIANNGDRANFGGNAKADEDGNVSGQEEYQDKGPADPFNLHGDVTVIVCDTSDPTRATIFGDATIDGSGSHTFRIDVRDFAEPGKGVDTYRMRVNAYDSGEQVLRGGNIQIHRQSKPTARRGRAPASQSTVPAGRCLSPQPSGAARRGRRRAH
jgi:hypothetical protein